MGNKDFQFEIFSNYAVVRNKIQNLTYNIRIFRDDDNNVFFVAKDAAAVLQYSNTAQAILNKVSDYNKTNWLIFSNKYNKGMFLLKL